MRQGVPFKYLPVVLNQDDVENILGLSKSSVQVIFHSEDFPALDFMKRNLIMKESFMAWLEHKEKEENAKKSGTV